MLYNECFLDGRVKFKEIVNFIVQKYDVGAKSNSYKKKYCEDSEYTKSGEIKFKYNGEKITLYYYYSNLLTRQEKDAAEKGDRNFWLSRKTQLYTKDTTNSRDVIYEILLNFGGSKVTSGSVERVDANPDKDIKPILRISQKKLRETFGGVYVEIK